MRLENLPNSPERKKTTMTTKKKKSKPAKSKKSKPIKGKAVKKSKPIKGKAVKKSKPIKGKAVKKSKPIKGKAVKKSKPKFIKRVRAEKRRVVSKKSSGYVEGRAGELYFSKESNLKKQVPYARSIKTQPTYKQAVDWWKAIGGGSSYFVIAKVISKKSKQEGYAIYDIRTQRERETLKSKLDGVSRARQLLLELGEDENEE